MSTKDLFGTDLPSEDESEDEDYVSENDGSNGSGSSVEDEDMSHSNRGESNYIKSIQKQKVAKIFLEMKQGAESLLLDEDHSDVNIDPVMLLFQQRVDLEADKLNHRPTKEYVLAELGKFTGSRGGNGNIDLNRYRNLARQGVEAGAGELVELAAAARAGLEGAKVEVEEEVRFAGEVVKLKKMVERTSSHAARFEKRKRTMEDQSQSLGDFQKYLNTIKSKRAVSSVEKSASDWNRVKMASEGLEQNLQSQKGFIEKQSFLARADIRQDDLRRDMRRQKLDG